MKLKQSHVSIVIVNWNSKEHTINIIKSLRHITYNNFDIIIVDNGSSDGSQKELMKKKYKNVTIIENMRNLGLAEGTNIGLREGLKRGSKYILTMNNDMYVKNDFLNVLVDVMEKHSEVSVSQPKIYYTEPDNMIWCAGVDFKLSGFKPREQGKIDRKVNEKPKYVDTIDCVLMMRSSVLKKIGLLNKKLFVIHELAEWGLRSRKKGYKCLYVPKSEVWHKVAASMEKLKKESEISLYYNIRNWLLVIKYNKNALYYLMVLFLQSTIFAAYRFARLIIKGNPKLILTYYIAVWHAIIEKTPTKLYPYK